MQQGICELSLDALHAHPANANVMSRDVAAKLMRHIRRSGCYPPLIVRPRPAGEGPRPEFELLDGHQRLAVLRRLKHVTAHCVVWDVDDQEALLLLATLNRLHGDDDPRLRGELLRRLSAELGAGRLPAMLPDTQAQLARLTRLSAQPPAPSPPQELARMPMAVHFFLLPDQRRRLEAALRRIGGGREAALMRLVEAAAAGAVG